MTDKLTDATIKLLACYSSRTPSQLKAGGFTHTDEFTSWLRAAYEDDSFLCGGDFISVFERCRSKDIFTLTFDETRACITYLVRQMRFESEPYPSITDGTLFDLLIHCLELTSKEENI